MKIEDIISAQNIKMPGFDILKTIVFLVLNLILLFLVTDNPILDIDSINNEIICYDTSSLEFLSQISFCFIFANLFIIAYSMLSAYFVKVSEIEDAKDNMIGFFKPKIALNISIIFFFMVITGWIVALGGIKNSPYATLLSMSPILITIQLFRDWKMNENRMFVIVYAQDTANKKHNKKNWRKLENRTKGLAYVPLFFILLSLILSHCNFDFLHTKLISNTTWFNVLYYIVYYFSIFIAFYGTLSVKSIKRLSKFLFY
jgi:hypothetical protein